jgi:hypothetical protein
MCPNHVQPYSGQQRMLDDLSHVCFVLNPIQSFQDTRPHFQMTLFLIHWHSEKLKEEDK